MENEKSIIEMYTLCKDVKSVKREARIQRILKSAEKTGYEEQKNDKANEPNGLGPQVIMAEDEKSLDNKYKAYSTYKTKQRLSDHNAEMVKLQKPVTVDMKAWYASVKKKEAKKKEAGADFLDKPYRHHKWFLGGTHTNKQALDYFIERKDFYLDLNPSFIRNYIGEFKEQLGSYPNKKDIIDLLVQQRRYDDLVIRSYEDSASDKGYDKIEYFVNNGGYTKQASLKKAGGEVVDNIKKISQIVFNAYKKSPFVKKQFDQYYNNNKNNDDPIMSFIEVLKRSQGLDTNVDREIEKLINTTVIFDDNFLNMVGPYKEEIKALADQIVSTYEYKKHKDS